ncbi:hypothetical protein PVAP13_5NG042508 [Panicum virgatum]|uniref:Uncharacterized protein n=1 Tax=Panicum virgatum TaxID=38727 RepID=A0A8T0RNS9_PANVG|nr:hypothetical protein PVAP13_5NG042508 [Panicum virgatum]
MASLSLLHPEEELRLERERDDSSGFRLHCLASLCRSTGRLQRWTRLRDSSLDSLEETRMTIDDGSPTLTTGFCRRKTPYQWSGLPVPFVHRSKAKTRGSEQKAHEQTSSVI